MKKTHLKFNYAPKMNGRNSRSMFAAYVADGNKDVEQEEKDFLKSIEHLDEAGQATCKAVRAQNQKSFEHFSVGLISKAEYEQQIADLKEANKTEKVELQKEIENLNKYAVTLAKQVKEVKVKGGNSLNPENRLEKLAEEIAENKADIEAIGKGVSGKELVIKANVTRSSIATTNEVMMIDGIGQLSRKQRSLYDVCTKLPVPDGNTQGIVHYVDWDEGTTVKAAAMVAEGATFPESTAAFKGYTLPLRKVGDTLPVTDEFFQDEVMAAAELDMFVTQNVESKIDDQLINGDNTGQNLKGLITSVPTYTAVASGITGANIYDLIVKVRSSISVPGGNKYSQFSAVMNQNSVDLLVLKKDSTNNYLFAPDHPIYKMIVVDNNVADNVLVVGDFRYARIYEKAGVELSKGLQGTQFAADLSTLKARKRLLFLIRNVDLTGFKKVTSISAALTLLAT